MSTPDPESLKRKRTAAKSRFTRTINDLKRALEEEYLDIDVVNSLYDDVNESWKNVSDKHDSYMSSVSDDEISLGDEWITELQLRYYEVRKKVNKIIADNKIKHTMENAKRVRDLRYTNFRTMCCNINQLIDKKCPIVSIERERTALLQQFADVKESHSKLSLLLFPGDDNDLQDWLAKLISEFSEVNRTIDTYVANSDVSTPKGPINIQLRKIPLPRFEGDIRTYPRFRRDFVELVMPTLGAKQGSFVLRQCLDKSIVRHLNSCGEDVNALLERLDERYGDPGKVTDVTINDIKNFKSTGTSEQMIEFINLVETGYNDLKALSMVKEICNSNIVSVIESKMPKNVARQWFREIHKSDTKVDKMNKFPGLLEFLRVERKALEYGLSDLRLDSATTQGRVNTVTSESSYSSTDIENCLIHTF